jgi:hypothetical protein
MYTHGGLAEAPSCRGISSKTARPRAASQPVNRLRLFRRAVFALLHSGGGPARETSPVPSEKSVVPCRSKNDEMPMITARFARVIQWCTGHQETHFLIIFQCVDELGKTCNQLDDNGDWRRRPHCGRIVLLPGRLIPPQRGATAPSRPPEQKLRQSRLACLASHALSSERHQGDGIFCIRITPQVSNVLVPPFAKGGKRGFPL